MPTASIKAEKVKQPSLEANEPLRQGITIVEHKIRNLEKRKTKLDGYKALQATGKELNGDQLSAIEKYDEVLQTLEFARELCKQLNTLATETAKAHKKQLRKEAAEKVQQDIARTKELLIMQDVLSNMGQEQVRGDLVEGKAKITVSNEELEQIDALYLELTSKQDETTTPYVNHFQGQAEHWSTLLEGKAKEGFGTTYAALRTKLMDIATSGYFDPPMVEQPAAPEPPQPAAEEIVEVQAPVEAVAEVTPEVVTPTITPNETAMPVMQEVSQLESQLIQQQQAAVVANAVAAAAASLRLQVFKSGPIDFIQDNEVEEPEEDNSIPTLTYTNQNYTPNKAPAQQVAERPPEDEWTESHQVEQVVPVQQQVPPPQQQDDDCWDESGDSGGQDSNHWQTQSHHHNQHQSNDGFIQAGGGRGRGGRGRGGRGGPNRTQQPRPNRGGYREGGYNREGGGGGYNREGGGGGYNREGGYNKDGQNFYQNGYRGGGGDRRGGGGNRNYSDRGGGGGRGGSGPRGGTRGGNNYRGNYRQQQ